MDNRVISKELSRLLLAGGLVAGVFLVLWQISPLACAIIVFELPYLAGIFLGGLALGYLPVRFLTPRLTFGQQMITALACGTGIYSLLVLVLGLAGLLQIRAMWLGLLIALGGIGLVILFRAYQKSAGGEQVVFESGRYWYVLLVALLPFLFVTLLCAAIPPGLLWSAEGGGYDTLEYHLQAPKEWFQAGRIHYLPHNAYSNFPFNAEMLYLLAMAAKGDPYQAIYLSQLIHVMFAVLFVAAVWVFTRPAGIKAACFAAVAAGTCAWLPYLAPLAYVEMGMIFTGTVALGLFLQMADPEGPPAGGAAAIGGFILGLSGGFKYTALAMIAAPVLALGFVLIVRRSGLKRGVLPTALAGAMCVAAMSPYLVRNFVWTGNPVFPMGYAYFGGRGWDEASAERWRKAHAAAEHERPVAVRLSRLYWTGLRNIVTDNFIAESYRTKGNFKAADAIFRPPPLMDLPQFGLVLLVLPGLVFFTRRQRLCDWLLLAVLVLQTLVWLFATHLQARFLVPWLVVLPFLVGRTAEAYGRGRFSIGLITCTVILIGGVALNFRETLDRYRRHTYFEGQSLGLFGQEGAFLLGKVPGYEYLDVVNKTPGARTMLLAEARPFYIRGPVLYWTVFNPNDFAAAAAVKGTREVKNYIARVRPDYIYIDWSEALRFCKSYGFDDCITPNLLNNLSSWNQFNVKRVGHWGPFLQYGKWKVPARVLYQVTYKAPPSRKTKRPVPDRRVNGLNSER